MVFVQFEEWLRTYYLPGGRGVKKSGRCSLSSGPETHGDAPILFQNVFCGVPPHKKRRCVVAKCRGVFPGFWVKKTGEGNIKSCPFLLANRGHSERS